MVKTVMSWAIRAPALNYRIEGWRKKTSKHRRCGMLKE